LSGLLLYIGTACSIQLLASQPARRQLVLPDHECALCMLLPPWHPFSPSQIDKCFGFDTAVEEAQRSLVCARVEAKSAGGICIVKLMGRDAGWIGLNASMASGLWVWGSHV
jgi:hypothetical protein